MAGVQEVLAGRYELLEVLGRGGMGVVYRARDRVLDRVVAVKVLPLDRAQEPTLVARFEREALAAAALSHRNIVAVFDFGADRETRFIVMEHLSGQSLATLLRERGSLGPREAADVAAQVAAALDAAHRAGIVHRDIKPANVMLDGQGHVKVLDFGIARLTAGVSLTQTATVLGSASYLAPELCLGAAADARSDIYALGCLLYELVTGEPPFTGEIPAAIIQRQISETPRSTREGNPAIPVALDALILAMLAKDPDHRPQAAGALVSSLPEAGGEDARPAPARVTAEPADVRPASTGAAEPVTVKLPPHGRSASGGDSNQIPTIPLRVADTAASEPTRVMPASPRTGGRGHRAYAILAGLLVVALAIVLLALTGGSPAHRRLTGQRSTTPGSPRHSTTTAGATTTAPTTTAPTTTAPTTVGGRTTPARTPGPAGARVPPGHRLGGPHGPHGGQPPGHRQQKPDRHGQNDQ